MKEISYTERAKFYEIETDDETMDHPFLLSLVNKDVKSILEIPCGTGRNIFKLSETGVNRVVGIDLEPIMIEKLTTRQKRNKTNDNITTFVGDMRNVRLNMNFDLIIVPREAFQLLTSEEDQIQALSTLREHLNENGTLVIDLATFIDSCNGVGSKIQPNYYNPQLKEGQVAKDWTKLLPSGEKLTRFHTQEKDEKGNIVIRFDYKFESCSNYLEDMFSKIRLRIITYEEVNKLVKRTGLVIKELYGDYEKTPFSNSSVRMILLLTRTPSKTEMTT